MLGGLDTRTCADSSRDGAPGIRPSNTIAARGTSYPLLTSKMCNFGALDVVLGGLVSHDEGNAKIARAGALHRCVSASAEPCELKFDDHIDEYSFSPPGSPPLAVQVGAYVPCPAPRQGLPNLYLVL